MVWAFSSGQGFNKIEIWGSFNKINVYFIVESILAGLIVFSQQMVGATMKLKYIFICVVCGALM